MLAQSPAPAPQAPPNPTRGGILPHIIWPSTAKAAEAELLAEASAWNTSVQASCDATTKASWAPFYSALVAFTSTDPGIWGLGGFMDRVQSWEDALYQWELFLQTKCPGGTAPVINPAPPEPPSPWPDVLKWGAIAVGAVAVAYGVGKVVTLIPTAKERAEARKLAPRLPTKPTSPRPHPSPRR